MVASPLDQYRATQVQTSSTAQIVVLLYDAALTSLVRTEDALAAGQYDLVSSRLIGVQNIVLELMNAVDLERGGKLATDLRSLYLFLYQRLVDANLRKSVEPIRLVARLMAQLREAWRASLLIGVTEPSRPASESAPAAASAMSRPPTAVLAGRLFG